jgi:hypothetical protein
VHPERRILGPNEIFRTEPRDQGISDHSGYRGEPGPGQAQDGGPLIRLGIIDRNVGDVPRAGGKVLPRSQLLPLNTAIEPSKCDRGLEARGAGPRTEAGS